jgi:hypothetical protein
MISDEDMYRFAEALVRWAEQDIAAGLVLLKRPAVPAFAQREDDQQRDHAADHKGDGRMLRENIDTIAIRMMVPSGAIHMSAATIANTINHGGTCWRCRG